MIETINRMFEAIDGRAWPLLGEFFDARCVYERPGYPPIEGLESLDRFYREERKIAEGRHLLWAHYERPGGMIVTGEFSGTLRDGSAAYAEFADCYRFAGGLIEHRRTYFYAPLVCTDLS